MAGPFRPIFPCQKNETNYSSIIKSKSKAIFKIIPNN